MIDDPKLCELASFDLRGERESYGEVIGTVFANHIFSKRHRHKLSFPSPEVKCFLVVAVLEQVPEELVVDLVVELNLLRLHDRAE